MNSIRIMIYGLLMVALVSIYAEKDVMAIADIQELECDESPDETSGAYDDSLDCGETPGAYPTDAPVDGPVSPDTPTPGAYPTDAPVDGPVSPNTPTPGDYPTDAPSDPPANPVSPNTPEPCPDTPEPCPSTPEPCPSTPEPCPSTPEPCPTSPGANSACIDVDVEGDATYCVAGITDNQCSANDNVCPKKGAVATSGCVEGTTSYDNGSCVLKTDTVCTELTDGTMGCAPTASTNNQSTSSASVTTISIISMLVAAVALAL